MLWNVKTVKFHFVCTVVGQSHVISVLNCELLKLARLVFIALFHFTFIQLFELLHIVHSYLEKRIVYCTLLILDLYFYAQSHKLFV